MDQEEIFLILDTNTYLHYRTFTDIDWCKVFSSKNICLVVPAVILDELDHNKNNHKFSHLRKRSQKISNLMEDFMENPSKLPRKDVRIDFLDEPDEISYAGMSYNDNRLIFAAKELAKQGKGDVILVTHDLGLTLRAKRRGITTRKLPDEHKLEFVDETGKKNRELEQKVFKLEQNFPKLSLKFEKDTIKIERNLLPPAIFPDLMDHMSFMPVKQEYDKKIEICQSTLSKNQSTDFLNNEQPANTTKRISRRRKKRNQPAARSIESTVKRSLAN